MVEILQFIEQLPTHNLLPLSQCSQCITPLESFLICQGYARDFFTIAAKKFSDSCRKLCNGHRTLLPGTFILHCGHGEYLVSNRYWKKHCSTFDQQKNSLQKFDLLNIPADEFGLIKQSFHRLYTSFEQSNFLRIRICTVWTFQPLALVGRDYT